jgi:ribosome-associated toxin RatA of RatAB toxin-antitoxin module
MRIRAARLDRELPFKIISRSIDASQVKIFSVVKDINRLPEMFPKHYSINVLEQSENHLYTEENVVTTGKEIH